MSMTWALNTTNDMVINREGKFQVVTGGDEVRQRIMTTLLHDYQEYFLNVPGGTPWYEFILGNKDIQVVGMILRQIILSVPGVRSLISFNANVANRSAVVNATVEVDVLNGTDIINVIADLSKMLPTLAFNDNFTYIKSSTKYITSSDSEYIVE